MAEWMNEWTNERMTTNEWMTIQVNEWMGGWMDGWMSERTNKWLQMNEWLYKWMNKWMNGWVDGWMNETQFYVIRNSHPSGNNIMPTLVNSHMI